MSPIDHLQLSDRERSELSQYRAVSVLAVVALLAGLASVLALAHPILWIFPVLAVSIALLALRRIDRSAETLTGRRIALAGMALALLFGTWAPSRVVVERIFIAASARKFAEYWFGLVRSGRIYQAHQWTQPANYRLPPDVDLKEYYQSDSTAKDELADFLSQQPVKTLLELRERAQPRFVQTLSVRGNAYESLTTQQFDILNVPEPVGPMAVQISVRRDVSPGHEDVQWRLNDIRLLEGRRTK